MRKRRNLTLRWTETVADSPDGGKKDGTGGIHFDFLPEAVDVDGNGGIITERFQPPDHFVEILAAEYLTGMAHQEEKKLIFPVFQGELLTV